MKKDILKAEIKQLNEIYKYLKSFSKLKSAQKEQQILIEFAVLKALRELLNYSIKDIERDLINWDFDEKKTASIIKLCNESKGEIALRDFEGMNEFTIKIDHYLSIFQYFNAFTVLNNDSNEYEQIISSVVMKWFNQIPKSYATLNGLQSFHLQFLLSQLTAYNLIAMEPYDFNEENIQNFNDNNSEYYTKTDKANELLNKKFPHLSEYNFQRKGLLNNCEKDFYFALLKYIRELNSAKILNYKLIPQVSLISVLDKYRGNYKIDFKSELYSIIDFGIFDKNFNLKYAIEVNGPSHSEVERMARDLKVKKILSSANIPLITFEAIEDHNNANVIIPSVIAEKFERYEDLKFENTIS